MFYRICKNDFLRKKVITIAVFIFITLAVVLGASATNIIANLIQSMTQLQSSSVAADITQMHAGEYNHSLIEQFTATQQENIEAQETMQLINIEGINVHFRKNETMAGTVQDIFFVVQNKKLDFLLDLNNQKLDVKPGTIAVPVYFMQTYNLNIGDVITVESGTYHKDFIIVDYARDFEMNASLTSSKRFVISQEDYDEMLAADIGKLEYLIEFRIKEGGNAQAVQDAYIAAGLPANGPLIPGSIFLVFNAMTDMIVVVIIVLISILLVVIASLCIRLTFLATIDEDLREIGVMKAIGISQKDIKKVYITKYRIMSIVAGVVGYVFSFAVVNLFNGNMRLYISADLSGRLKYVLSFIAPLLVYAMIIMYCKKIFKRVDKISAVEALRTEVMDTGKEKKNKMPLLKNKNLNMNSYMGIRDVFKRAKLYRLLLVIIIVCTFIMILPINMYNTISSPKFSTYMGIGRSDMRIDIRQADSLTTEFNQIHEAVENDKDIAQYAEYITCAYQVKNSEDEWQYINIELGDFSKFPLNYLEGIAPSEANDIALSYANAKELNKKIGDDLLVRYGEVEKSMKVCGIYQDITNGGRTAKASMDLGINSKSILWYIISMDVAPGVNVSEKMDYYRDNYQDIEVNDILEYTRQTLGNIIKQLKRLVIGGIVIAVIIVALITALFLKMLLSKDMSQIAIMRSLGLTSEDIKHQYMAGTMMILIVGIIIGVLIANYLGEVLVTLAMSFMGVAKFTFVNVLWQTCIICPVIMIIVVGIVISKCCQVTVKEDISINLRS